MALNASSADVFVDDTMLQMDVIDCHTDQRQLIREGESAQPVVCGAYFSSIMHTFHAISSNCVLNEYQRSIQ